MILYIIPDNSCFLWKVLVSIIILPTWTQSQECEPGRYGMLCSNFCGKCLNSTCNRFTGVCPDGCQVGYHGNLCDNECGYCRSMLRCDKQTGICLDGCQDGYHGVYCKQICDDGTFGFRCSSTCHCKTGTCNNINGTCAVPGCITGWKGNSCSEPCDFNEFGPDCTNKCYCKAGGCSDNGTCDENGCASGWKGQTCSDECEHGYYGESCALVCVHCLNFTCNKQTGVCGHGCQDGYRGAKCNQICAEQKYGRNCKNTCGHCLDDQPCNPHNGSCPGGCLNGWEGQTCAVKVGEELLYYYIGGGIAGGVVLTSIILAVIIIVIVKRRRRSRHLNGRKSEYEPVVRETLYPRKYEQAEQAEKEEGVEGEAYYNTETQTMYYNPGANTSDKAKSTSEENVYEYVAEEYGIALPDLERIIKEKKKNNEFQQEFQIIPNESNLTTSAANESTNKIKNRNLQILPYDRTRVILELTPNKPNSDYINASFIDGIDRPQAYIATQAPRKNTVGDFWRMIWQMNSVIIIMLTKLQENRKSSCEQYWPEPGDTLTLEDLQVTLESQQTYAFFNIRVMTVLNTPMKERRIVKQFHFYDWPEMSLPDPIDLCMFHRRILKNRNKISSPLVVHCSDGSERTGTFIALDALFNQGKNTGRVNITKFIQGIRKERTKMFQSLNHFKFLHEVLLEAFRLNGLLVQKVQIVTVLKNTLERGGSSRKSKNFQLKQFERLKSTLPNYGAKHFQVSRDPANRKKNRNSKVLAATKYRVVLKLPITERTDYINAVKVPTFTKSLGFLVTSFPLRDTAVDFWRMMFDYNSNIIVSLVEIDHIKESRLWWPESGGKITSAPFTVQRGTERRVTDNISTEDVTVTNEDSSENKIVKVFELTSWSRKNVLPPNFDILLKLVNDVHELLCTNGNTPITVMSLDGAVRCGLFCAVFNIVQSIKVDGEADVFEIIRQLKIRRPEFIQTSDQYSFCCDTARYITPVDNEYLEPQ